MAYAAGVDVGSTQTKAVIVNEAREIVTRALVDTGANVFTAAEHAFHEVLRRGAFQEEGGEYVIGTGYGRYRVPFGNTQVTEVSCHARGAIHMSSQTRAVLDRGGRDTNAPRVCPRGALG